MEHGFWVRQAYHIVCVITYCMFLHQAGFHKAPLSQPQAAGVLGDLGGTKGLWRLLWGLHILSYFHDMLL